ncbi:MAG: hypothetical protein LBK53_00225 [Heliobacteriaceae bacterium]|nr:hypothetical protein [Heliobacteriaceae bacterium]
MKISNYINYKPPFGRVFICGEKDELFPEPYQKTGIEILEQEQQNNHAADITVTESRVCVRDNVSGTSYYPSGVYENIGKGVINWWLSYNSAGVYTVKHKKSIKDEDIEACVDKLGGYDLAAAQDIANSIELNAKAEAEAAAEAKKIAKEKKAAEAKAKAAREKERERAETKKTDERRRAEILAKAKETRDRNRRLRLKKELEKKLQQWGNT